MNRNEIKELINEIVREGAHNDHTLSNLATIKVVRHLVEEMCINLGINTHIGYDGVERNEDLILYLHNVNEELINDKEK